MSFSRKTFDIDNFDNQAFVKHSLDINTVTFLPKKFE